MIDAQAVDRVRVLAIHKLQGVTILETSCEGYEAFRRLPPAVTWEGLELGKTGWNSDTGRACYKSDAALARPGIH